MQPPSSLLTVSTTAGDLGRIEQALRESVRAPDPYLTEIASHLITAGGKRLRPLCTVMSALTALDGATDAVIQGGVAVELVHLGSLYHDDVMDEADTRRGIESVNARWGNLKAILAGDFLLARASEIAASLGTEVAGLLAATIAQLCNGEIAQLRCVYDVGRTEEDYREAILGKTASLFSSACRIGAIVSDQSRERIDAITECGLCFGMVFQVYDDVLDLTATEEQLGKPVGHDLVEGVYTLPVIHTLASGGAAAAELTDLLGGPIGGAELDKALGIVRSGDGVASALAVGRGYADRAREVAGTLGPTSAARALGDAAHALLDTLTPADRA